MQAMAGEEVIIAKNGRPVVQLIPLKRAFPEPGFMKGMAKATPDALGARQE